MVSDENASVSSCQVFFFSSACCLWEFPIPDVLGCDQWFTSLWFDSGRVEKTTKAKLDGKGSCILHQLSLCVCDQLKCVCLSE